MTLVNVSKSWFHTCSEIIGRVNTRPVWRIRYSSRAYSFKVRSIRWPPLVTSRGRIQGEIVDLEHTGTLGGASAKQGANAGKEFVDGKGLGEVIVGSCVKTLDALVHLRLSGQDQNRSMNLRLADALENVQSGQ